MTFAKILEITNKKIAFGDNFLYRKKSGQVFLEYLLILTIIALITILSFSSFFTSVKEAAFGEGGFRRNVVERIIK